MGDAHASTVSGGETHTEADELPILSRPSQDSGSAAAVMTCRENSNAQTCIYYSYFASMSMNTGYALYSHTCIYRFLPIELSCVLSLLLLWNIRGFNLTDEKMFRKVTCNCALLLCLLLCVARAGSGTCVILYCYALKLFMHAIYTSRGIIHVQYLFEHSQFVCPSV